MTGKLTDQELREAAAEAGISPEELRRELVVRDGGTPAPIATGPGNTGVSVYKAETSLALPPEQASETVRKTLERLSGHRGHRQGAGQAAIVDETRGLVYRIATDGDGAGGALVRVDVDPTSGSGNLALGAFMIGGASLGVMALGWLLGAMLLVIAGVGIGAFGTAALVASRSKLKRAQKEAQALVAQAMIEAEDSAALQDGPRAIAPAGRAALPSA